MTFPHLRQGFRSYLSHLDIPMKSESGVKYVIDADDNISAVNEGWCEFAKANDADDLLPPNIIGQSLWNHISDPTTSDLYKQIIARVRKGGPSSFSLRCDGPSCRLRLEMKITGLPDGSVEFSTIPVSVDERDKMDLLSRRTPRSSQQLRVCAWCNRVDAGSGTDDWVEVEEATERMKLFELDELPQLTHGICNACHARMRATIAAKS